MFDTSKTKTTHQLQNAVEMRVGRNEQDNRMMLLLRLKGSLRIHSGQRWLCRRRSCSKGAVIWPYGQLLSELPRQDFNTYPNVRLTSVSTTLQLLNSTDWIGTKLTDDYQIVIFNSQQRYATPYSWHR